MADRTTGSRKQWAIFAVGILVTLACLGWVAFQIFGNPAQLALMKEAFRQADYRMLVPIWALLAIFYWLKAWRWRMLLSPVGDFKPARDLLGPTMIGFAFNNLFPMRIGEFVRCLVFSQQQRVPLTSSISSLVLERIFDGIAILFYLAIGLVFVPGLDPELKQAALVFSALAVAVVIFSLCYVIWTKPIVAFVEAVLKRIRIFPHGPVDKLCRILEAGALGLAAIKNVRLVIAMLVISLIKWAINAVLILLSLWAFGLKATLMHGLVLMGVTAFAVALPSSPGFFGIIQAAFVYVGDLFGFAAGTMVAASFFYHLALWIPVTAIGLGYFWSTGLSFRQVRLAAPSGVGPQEVLDRVPEPGV